MNWHAVAVFWFIVTVVAAVVSFAVAMASDGLRFWLFGGIAGVAVFGTAASLLSGLVFR